MIRFHKSPEWIQWVFPQFIWKRTGASAIYLTFDDGPHPDITPWVLRQLKRIGAKATFFCLGSQVASQPELVRQILQEGHAIGNHTYSHLNGWKVGADSYLFDVEKCDTIFNNMGIQTQLFRPPYGKIRRAQRKLLKNRKLVLWSHAAYDFDPSLNVTHALEKLMEAKPGSIIVLHENEKSFQNLKRILPPLLDHFDALGYPMESIT